MNARMPDLVDAFERAGFEDVRTVISSGNVVFTARRGSEAALERKAEAAMKARLGRAFPTLVREIDALRRLLEADPYSAFALEPRAKRVVTFLAAKPSARLELPIELHGARILRIDDREVFSAYVPSPHGPVFMSLIEKTFGKHVTTRTWETVAKVAADPRSAPRRARARAGKRKR